jgi:hypothetical protein
LKNMIIPEIVCQYADVPAHRTRIASRCRLPRESAIAIAAARGRYACPASLTTIIAQRNPRHIIRATESDLRCGRALECRAQFACAFVASGGDVEWRTSFCNQEHGVAAGRGCERY